MPGNAADPGRVAEQRWLGWLWPTQLVRWGLGLCKTAAAGRKWLGFVQQVLPLLSLLFGERVR